MDLEQELERAADLLARRGAAEWEVMSARLDQLSVAVRGREVDKFQQSASQGLAIRVVAQGRLGFSYLMGRDAGGSLETAVDQALAGAEASDLEFTAGLARPAETPEVGGLFDSSLAEEPVEAKRERALAVARAAREADPRVVHVHPAEVSEVASRLRLVNSHGLDLSRRGTAVTAVAQAVAAEGGQQEMGWAYDSRRFLADLDSAAVGAEAGRRAAAFLGAGPVADGRYPVILENQVAAEFLDLLAESLSGENLVKGRSLLAKRRGQRVFSPAVTILDDGVMPKGLGTAPFDDEGTPAAAKTLVHRGVVEGFIFDRLWGAAAGESTTGNAVRGGLKAPPGVGFTNLRLAPGSGGLAELAAGLERGLVISEVMGAHTADPVSGEFSLGAAGTLVENGRLARPVRSIAIAGQVVELFAAVAAVGEDVRFLGRTGCPSLLVEGLSVSG
jgi:PmbA protein